jgi:hypothetical protein
MDISFGNGSIGYVAQAKECKPSAQRGFDVVSINIPLELHLRERESRKGFVLSGVTAELKGGESRWLLGSGFVRGIFGPTAHPLPTTLEIRCSPRALAQYEAARSGGPVQLTCEVRSQIQRLELGGGVLPDPTTASGSIALEFSKEDWTRALRCCGLSASVVVEIPFPLTDSHSDDAGLRALLDAVEAFEHGGTTSWKDSIGHIRPYLEKWKDLEPLDKVALKEPKDGSPTDRTWKLLNLRDALYKCCHFWLHETKSACTRQDALFAVSTFASLLNAVRS